MTSLMTSLADRPNTALLVIDLQNGVVANIYRRDEVLQTVAKLVEQARDANVPVVWVRDDELVVGSEDWQIAPELSPDPDEPIIDKAYRDAFEATRLEEVLATSGVGKVIVVGAETDMCIRSTLHGALARGYNVTLVSDAHTTGDRSHKGAPLPAAVISHTNMYWSNQKAPGRSGNIIDSNAIVFGES